VTSISERTPLDEQHERPEAHGTHGNERLTAATGAVLLVLFAVEGVTLLFLRHMLTLHFFIGFLLIGPVCLKLGSTFYRFTRYYTGAPAYRKSGPPHPLLRVLGPLVVITSVGVLATGVGLAFFGTRYGPIPLLLLHKADFICWAAVMTIHVLAYVWRLPRLIGADLRLRPSRHGLDVPGRPVRWALLVLSLGAGLVLAMACVHLVSGWSR